MRRLSPRFRAPHALLMASALCVAAACGDARGERVEITVPEGATLSAVADTLEARGLVGTRGLFVLYARLRGDDHRIRAGRYALRTDMGWGEILGRLTRGEVLTEALTIPEGYRLDQMVEPIAALTGRPADEVRAALQDTTSVRRLELPGPTLEGYLFPDTYHFAPGVAVEEVIRTMAERYKAVWSDRRRARLDSLGMTERELVTLASIIQAEARKVDEMPRIASVYHNRLRRGWLLQADPTVLYALGGPRERLLYAAIDSVRDDPYNTYAHRGLPPGPIGAPGEAAIDAALWPAEEEYLYFVARPDGSHVFSRTLAEHNRAKAESRRLINERARQERQEGR